MGGLSARRWGEVRKVEINPLRIPSRVLCTRERCVEGKQFCAEARERIEC